MLSLAWTWFVSLFEKLLKEKHYKIIILVLIVIFLGNTVVLTNKVSKLSDNIDSLKLENTKMSSAAEKRVYSYINQLHYDAIQIFEAYTSSNAEDLSTIIDKTSVTADNQFLLKKLVEKSKTEIIQEIKKSQVKNRYFKMDSLHHEKLSVADTVKTPYYATRK